MKGTVLHHAVEDPIGPLGRANRKCLEPRQQRDFRPQDRLLDGHKACGVEVGSTQTVLDPGYGKAPQAPVTPVNWGTNGSAECQ